MNKNNVFIGDMYISSEYLDFILYFYKGDFKCFFMESDYKKTNKKSKVLSFYFDNNIYYNRYIREAKKVI